MALKPSQNEHKEFKNDVRSERVWNVEDGTSEMELQCEGEPGGDRSVPVTTSKGLPHKHYDIEKL